MILAPIFTRLWQRRHSLEAPRLAARGCSAIRLATIHPGTHGPIVGETIGVVHILEPSEAAEHGLA
jgi:hypothetical protein